jgi:hypothetical protein
MWYSYKTWVLAETSANLRRENDRMMYLKQ